jgi:hypothetical protein
MLHEEVVMRLVGALVALVCLSGCGGTVILRSGNPPPPVVVHTPPPAPVPCHDCRYIGRDEALHIVKTEARRHNIGRVRVGDVDRNKHDWRIECRGVDACGHRVEVRARVHRRSGAIESFRVSSREHDKHRKHRERHDHDD